MVDRASARPAGNLVTINGRLWRPVQDCTDGYGCALGLAEVAELSPTSFKQVVRHIIRPGPLWPGRKLHTLNRCGRLELIDGTVIQPKLRALGLPGRAGRVAAGPRRRLGNCVESFLSGPPYPLQRLPLLASI